MEPIFQKNIISEIVSTILDAVNVRATKTKIMYKAFLSYSQLREYLSLLIENNLTDSLEGTPLKN